MAWFSFQNGTIISNLLFIYSKLALVPKYLKIMTNIGPILPNINSQYWPFLDHFFNFFGLKLNLCVTVSKWKTHNKTFEMLSKLATNNIFKMPPILVLSLFILLNNYKNAYITFIFRHPRWSQKAILLKNEVEVINVIKSYKRILSIKCLVVEEILAPAGAFFICSFVCYRRLL